jgi:hypothetical protein
VLVLHAAVVWVNHQLPLQDQLGTLSDAAASTADKEAALAELQVLVEPIDNANGEGAGLS